MKKIISKKLIPLLSGALALVVATSFLFGGGVKQAKAAIRSSVVMTENFLTEELDGKKWNLETGEQNKIKSVAEGNGRLNVAVAPTGNMESTYYIDKYIEVGDSEDLVIEYSVTDLSEGGKDVQNIMLVKGLGSAEEEPSYDMDKDNDAKLEGIASFYDYGRYYTSIGYAIRGGVTAYNDSDNQISIAKSNRSDAVKNYYKSFYTPVYNGEELIGYDVPYGYDNVTTDTSLGLPEVDVRSWCGEKFGCYLWSEDYTRYLENQSEIDLYSVYHVMQKGFTFKHVYRASGGYDCYVKPNEVRGAEYQHFLSLSDNYPGTDEKRFVERSGYVGFNVFGGKFNMEFDFINVYTSTNESQNAVGQNKNYKARIDFDEVDGLRYGVEGNGYEEFKSTTEKIFSTTLYYDEMGFKFDNPAPDNYLYSGSKYKVKYDGLFDDYVKLDATFSITELTKGKDFGFIFGGSSTDHLLNKNGNVYIYLTVKDGASNYYIGVDHVEGGARKPIGAIKNSGIPVVGNDNSGEVYSIKIIAKKAGGVVVSVYNVKGEKISSDLSLGNEKTVLKNRFCIYTAENKDYVAGESEAVITMKKLSVSNTYYYDFPGSNGRSIEEKFEGVDEEGYFAPSDGFDVYEGELNKFVDNAGVFVKDGALHMRGVGHRSGLATSVAYNSFEMYFDVIDMQRTSEAGSPISSGIILIEFGSLSEGLTTGANNTISIRNPMVLKDANGNVTHRLDGQPGQTMSYNKAEADVDNVSTIGAILNDMPYDGVLRHNLLDPALEGKAIRFKVEFTQDSDLKVGYCILGLEDESMLNEPILTAHCEGGEGYIGLTSTHETTSSYSCNMVIDNVKIIDTDTLSVREEESFFGDEDEEEEEEVDNEKGLPWWAYVLIGVGSAAVIGGATTVTIVLIKRKRRSDK